MKNSSKFFKFPLKRSLPSSSKKRSRWKRRKTSPSRSTPRSDDRPAIKLDLSINIGRSSAPSRNRVPVARREGEGRVSRRRGPAGRFTAGSTDEFEEEGGSPPRLRAFPKVCFDPAELAPFALILIKPFLPRTGFPW